MAQKDYKALYEELVTEIKNLENVWDMTEAQDDLVTDVVTFIDEQDITTDITCVPLTENEINLLNDAMESDDHYEWLKERIEDETGIWPDTLPAAERLQKRIKELSTGRGIPQ